MSDETTGQDIMDLFDAQIKAQGVGIITLKDSYALMFTDTVLEHLLEKAKGNKDRRVMVLVQHPKAS